MSALAGVASLKHLSSCRGPLKPEFYVELTINPRIIQPDTSALTARFCTHRYECRCCWQLELYSLLPLSRHSGASQIFTQFCVSLISVSHFFLNPNSIHDLARISRIWLDGQNVQLSEVGCAIHRFSAVRQNEATCDPFCEPFSNLNARRERTTRPQNHRTTGQLGFRSSNQTCWYLQQATSRS